MIDKYDISKGFVLDNEQALEYLEEVAKGFYEHAVDIDGEEIGAIIDDIMTMAHAIKVEWAKYEWVLFNESPMSASGIMIKPMVEKE